MIVSWVRWELIRLTHWPLGDVIKSCSSNFHIKDRCLEYFHETTCRWMPLNLIDDYSTLVHVMACCLVAPSHYLNQCWPIHLSSYGFIRIQWVNKPLWSSGGSRNIVSCVGCGSLQVIMINRTGTGCHADIFWQHCIDIFWLSKNITYNISVHAVHHSSLCLMNTIYYWK